MTVTLYTCSSENNRLDKSGYLVSVGAFAGTPTPPTSVYSPTLTVNSSSNISAANYMYIAETGKYYYITDLQWLGNSVWQVSGRVDPLYTYNTAIRGCTAWINRNENTHNDRLTDNAFPAEITKIDSALFTGGTNWYGSEHSGGSRFIVIAQCKPATNANIGAGMTALCGPAGTISEWVRGLDSLGIVDTRSGFDFVSRIFRLPVEPAVSVSPGLVHFPFVDGGYAVPSNMGIVGNGSTTATFSGTILSHCGNKPYRAFSPYAKYLLRFAPFGVIELDPEYLFYGQSGDKSCQSATITIKVIVDNLTGEAGLYISNGSLDDIMLASANVAVDLPATKDHISFSNLAGVALGIGAGAASLAAGNPMGAFSLVNSISKLSDVRQTAMQLGGAKIIDLAPIVTTHYKPVPEEGAETKGLPLEKEGTVSSYSGFTVCETIHLDGVPASESEKTEIETAFRSGVIL